MGAGGRVTRLIHKCSYTQRNEATERWGHGQMKWCWRRCWCYVPLSSIRLYGLQGERGTTQVIGTSLLSAGHPRRTKTTQVPARNEERGGRNEPHLLGTVTAGRICDRHFGVHQGVCRTGRGLSSNDEFNMPIEGCPGWPEVICDYEADNKKETERSCGWPATEGRFRRFATVRHI